MSERLKVAFGPLAPRIADQLGDVVPSPCSDKMRHIQLDADAVARLSVRGILTDAETNRARKRIMKHINMLVREARDED